VAPRRGFWGAAPQTVSAGFAEAASASLVYPWVPYYSPYILQDLLLCLGMYIPPSPVRTHVEDYTRNICRSHILRSTKYALFFFHFPPSRSPHGQMGTSIWNAGSGTLDLDSGSALSLWDYIPACCPSISQQIEGERGRMHGSPYPAQLLQPKLAIP
jgi:hypothetical protein